MTICFVAHGANIVILHGNFGPLTASTAVENTKNFLEGSERDDKPKLQHVLLNIC